MTPLFRILTPLEALRLGWRYMAPRRWLCVALVLASLAAGGFLNGCAEYETREPIAPRGTVTLTWEIGSVPGTHCGLAREIARDHWLITFQRQYGFDHPCWAHELAHAFGGEHQ